MKTKLLLLGLLITGMVYAQTTDVISSSRFNEADLAFSYPDSVCFIIETDSLFIEYEKQLGTYRQQIPCDCFPCAMYCYRIVQIEPDYYDFKRWYKSISKLKGK